MTLTMFKPDFVAIVENNFGVFRYSVNSAYYQLYAPVYHLRFKMPRLVD